MKKKKDTYKFSCSSCGWVTRVFDSKTILDHLDNCVEAKEKFNHFDTKRKAKPS